MMWDVHYSVPPHGTPGKAVLTVPYKYQQGYMCPNFLRKKKVWKKVFHFTELATDRTERLSVAKLHTADESVCAAGFFILDFFLNCIFSLLLSL